MIWLTLISLAYLTLIMSQPTNVTPSTSQCILRTFIRGRNVNSVQIIHLGYCYGKDKTPTTDGRQAWRCVKRFIKCPGRLHTLVSTNAVVGESMLLYDNDSPANRVIILGTDPCLHLSRDILRGISIVPFPAALSFCISCRL